MSALEVKKGASISSIRCHPARHRVGEDLSILIGGGSPFRKAGRYPLYHPDDLHGWVGGKLSDPVMSTSALVSDATEEQKVNPDTPLPRCRIAGAVVNESQKAHRSTK